MRSYAIELQVLGQRRISHPVACLQRSGVGEGAPPVKCRHLLLFGTETVIRADRS